MLRTSGRLAGFTLALVAIGSVRAARADDQQLPLVHPLYVHLPEAPEEDALRRAFTAAVGRYKLGPVEVVDVPAPAAPRAPDLLKTGIINTQKIAFGEALHDLDAAAAEVSSTGGAGLSTDELSDLYLNRAIATARADWNATAGAPPTEARTRAYADYLRAAALTPGRTLNTREIPPQAVADFTRAVAEIRARPRGTLTVSGSADAQVALDGGAPDAGGGRDRVPRRRQRRASDPRRGAGPRRLGRRRGVQPAVAGRRHPVAPAARSRRAHRGGARPAGMGARFRAGPRTEGRADRAVGVRLIDTSGQERDAVLVTPANEAGMIDSAVMRLDETARRIAQGRSAVGDAAPHAGRRCRPARAADSGGAATSEGLARRGSPRLGARSLAAAHGCGGRPVVIDHPRRRGIVRSLSRR
jgi:hypothetical protein